MKQKVFVTLWRSARQMADLHVAINDCAVPGLCSAKESLAGAVRSAVSDAPKRCRKTVKAGNLKQADNRHTSTGASTCSICRRFHGTPENRGTALANARITAAHYYLASA
jgi:hypothetical protein